MPKPTWTEIAGYFILAAGIFKHDGAVAVAGAVMILRAEIRQARP